MTSPYADYKRPRKPRAKGPAAAPTSTPEYKARLAVQRLDGAWTDMDWSLCQAPSIKAKKGHKHHASPLAGAPPLRLQPPSPIGTLWTLMALLSESQEPTSAPGQWATLGSELYSPKARRHPSEVLPPPFEHSAYLYLFTTRFPPAAQQLGIHALMDDPDVWSTYTHRYRKGRITLNPVVRALLQCAETFVPPATWPPYLLRVILNQAAVPFFPSPQRVADVLLMGAPLAPSFIPRQRGASSVSDVTEPYAYLLLALIGITPEQMSQAGIPLPPARIAELAADGLARALKHSQIFRIWFSGVDTRQLPNAALVPEDVHAALEVDAYPPGWTMALAHTLEFHIDKALVAGTARPRCVPRHDQRAPAGHTWTTIEEALSDPRNPVALIYANYYLAKKDSPAVKSVIADLTHFPQDPANTYGKVRPKQIVRRPLYALSRPETHAVLQRIAEDLRAQPRKRPVRSQE